MRRRHFFPAVLLGAAGLWSLVAGSASTPTQSHDYLNALVVDENYARGTRWIATDIKHSDKITQSDKALFIRLLEQFDSQGPVASARRLFLDQADTEFQSRTCRIDACQFDIYLNRVVTPNFVHGDLRLVQLHETSIRQPVSVSGDEITYGKRSEETRQLRYMLTERGWVLKAVETVTQMPHAPAIAQDLETPKMSGLNYYPRTAPWDKFWIKFPVEEIEQDLDSISRLGANAVRIFVQYEHFSNLDTQEDGLLKLKHFLHLCADRNIKVIVTLFDLRADYRPQNWSRDSVHLSTILNEIHAHEALLAVDLKNQPDLDFAPSGEKTVLAWLEAMMASARQTFPEVALTIGWSDPARAANLSDQVNLVSFHDYNNPKGLAARFEQLRTQVGDKPIFATEIGHSRWSLTGDKPDRQAVRLSKQFTQLQAADGVFVWTLNDFDEIGSNIVGHRPWRKAQQKNYGITERDGQWRPAANAFFKFNQTFHSTH